MSPFLALTAGDSACACGYPCELTRLYYALTWAEADRQRHERREQRAFRAIWPFKATR